MLPCDTKPVLDAIRDRIRRSPLGEEGAAFVGSVGAGKMLRSRLALLLGDATGVPSRPLVAGAAAVEMVHAASLLHDDVIDGGELRRGQPTFWARHGVQGAILFGDYLLSEAIDMVRELDAPTLLDRLICCTRDVCLAEVQQELVWRGRAMDWQQCVQLARRKTGALFAFAAAVAAGGDERLADALQEAGYELGTAYQLADDVLDAHGDDAVAGKSLGSDRSRHKGTAVSATGADGVVHAEEVAACCRRAAAALAHWPHVGRAWDQYMDLCMRPVLELHLDDVLLVEK